MAINVTIPTVLARHAGGIRAHTVSGSTVGEAIGNLVRDNPDLGKRLAEATAPDNAFVAIYLNDEDARLLQGLDTPVNSGDEITVVSAIAGG
jgi:molybdopterin converting factor small subunit